MATLVPMDRFQKAQEGALGTLHAVLPLHRKEPRIQGSWSPRALQLPAGQGQPPFPLPVLPCYRLCQHTFPNNAEESRKQTLCHLRELAGHKASREQVCGPGPGDSCRCRSLMGAQRWVAGQSSLTRRVRSGRHRGIVVLIQVTSEGPRPLKLGGGWLGPSSIPAAICKWMVGSVTSGNKHFYPVVKF